MAEPATASKAKGDIDTGSFNWEDPLLLDSGQIGHAVLDVFATEPLPQDASAQAESAAVINRDALDFWA